MCVCVCVEIFFYRGFHKLCVFFLENLINWQKRHVRFFRLSVKIVGSDGCVFLDSLAAEGILGNDSISLNCSQNISRLINQNSLHSWVLHRHSRGHEPHVEDLWSRGLFVFVFSAQTCYSHLGVFSLLSSSRSRFSGSSGPDRADRCPTPTLGLLRHRFWRLPSLQFWTRGQRGSSDKVLHPWPILQWLCHHCHGQSHHTERWSSVRHHWCSSEGHSCRISPKKKEKKCRRRENDLNIYINVYCWWCFQVVHLGVALSEVEDGSQRVVLYYTDPGTSAGTREAASFKMGDLTGRWARFTLTVQGSEVRNPKIRFVKWSSSLNQRLKTAQCWTTRGVYWHDSGHMISIAILGQLCY